MAGYRKIFLEETDFGAFSTSGSVSNLITTNAFPYMATHAGTISGLQELSLQAVEFEEVAAGDINSSGNTGKYAVTTDNTIKLAVDKSAVTTEKLAADYLIGLKLKYQMSSLAYFGSTPMYTVLSVAADGTEIGSTKPTDTNTIITKILALDDDLNVNLTPGFYSHTLTRSLVNE